jgi:tetratricopeptide (TPR) repeat protein
LLGRIYQKLGQPELAAQQFKATESLIQRKKAGSGTSSQDATSSARPDEPAQARDTPQAPTANLNKADSLRTQAHSAVETGDFEKALSLLIEARKTNPQDPAVLYDFGMVALHLSLFSDAAKAFTEDLGIRKDDPNASYGLGRAYLGLTKYQEARNAYERYLQVRPDDASAHYALGMALAALQMAQDARKQFEISIQQQPLQTESYFQLGLLDLEDKQLDAASANFRHVLDRDPRHAGALTGMGRVYFEEKEYSPAVESFRNAIAIDTMLRQAHYYLGLTYARMGRKDESAKELALATQIEHEEAEKQRLGLKIVKADQP